MRKIEKIALTLLGLSPAEHAVPVWAKWPCWRHVPESTGAQLPNAVLTLLKQADLWRQGTGVEFALRMRVLLGGTWGSFVDLAKNAQHD